MKTVVKAVLFAAVLVLLAVRPASAQIQVSGGYALVDWDGCCAHGFMVDAAHPIHRVSGLAIGAVGEFGWTRFTGLESDTTYSGGVRVTWLPDSKVPIHAQVTFGGLHWSVDGFEGFPATTGNDFVMAFGAGTIVKVTKMIGVKPQVDWFILPVADSGNTWFFRFTANAVINLHHK